MYQFASVTRWGRNTGPRAALMHRGEAVPELRNGRRYLCCYLGIMGPQDGVDVLLRAIEHYVRDLDRHDCQFGLLGFGDCLDELRELCTELGLDDYVTFTGRVDSTSVLSRSKIAALIPRR